MAALCSIGETSTRSPGFKNPLSTRFMPSVQPRVKIRSAASATPSSAARRPRLSNTSRAEATAAA